MSPMVFDSKYQVKSTKCNRNASQACMIIFYKASLATNYLCARNESCKPDTFGTYGFSHIYCCFEDNCNKTNSALVLEFSFQFKLFIFFLFYCLFKKKILVNL